VKIEVYELASSAGGLEMVQKWRAQAGAVVFYTDRYFAVVRSGTADRARLTAFITALQKLLGAVPTRSSSG
jgi:hypothetical protein